MVASGHLAEGEGQPEATPRESDQQADDHPTPTSIREGPANVQGPYHLPARYCTVALSNAKQPPSGRSRHAGNSPIGDIQRVAPDADGGPPRPGPALTEARVPSHTPDAPGGGSGGMYCSGRGKTQSGTRRTPMENQLGEEGPRPRR